MSSFSMNFIHNEKIFSSKTQKSTNINTKNYLSLKMKTNTNTFMNSVIVQSQGQNTGISSYRPCSSCGGAK